MFRYFTAQEVEERLENADNDAQRIKLLLGDARGLLESDPPAYLEFANRYIEKAKSLAEQEVFAQLLTNRATALFRSGSIDEAEIDLDAALGIAEALSHNELRAETLNLTGRITVTNGKLDEGLKILQQARSLAPPGSIVLVRILINIGMAEIQLGKYLQAYETHAKALDTIDANQLHYPLCSIHCTLGILCGYLERHDEALEYFQESVRLSRIERHPYITAQALTNIVGTQCVAGDISATTFEALNEAQMLMERFGDRHTLTCIELHFAKAYFFREDYASAEKHCITALNMAKENNFIDIEYQTRRFLAQIYVEVERYDESLSYAEENLTWARERNMEREEFLANDILIDIQNRAGLYREAIESMREYMRLYKKILHEQTDQRLSELQVKMDLESTRLRLELAQAEAQMQKIKAQEYEKRMAIARNESTAQALQIAHKNDLLLQIREGIKDTRVPNAKLARQRANAVIQHIDMHLADQNAWQRFEERFKTLHPEFLHTLQSRFPAISATESKVCALIKLNIHTSDICRILTIAQRTLESYRYRIRKKLGIDGSREIADFLNSLD